jgi:hypothetical protein
MPNRQKVLYAVELDISRDTGQPPDSYWVIHVEYDSDPKSNILNLCVYETKQEAREAAKGRDHESRIVKFVRVGVVK